VVQVSKELLGYRVILELREKLEFRERLESKVLLGFRE
jgi:hypothetical protein